jgi:hypothetical protein
MFVVEIKAIGEPVWISYTLDGSIKEKTLEAEESMRLDVRDALKISYAKVKANKLQVTANGRRIDVPVEGLEITRANLSQLIQGSASTPQPVVRSTPAPSTPRPTPRPAQSPRPRPSLAPTIIRPTRSPEQ